MTLIPFGGAGPLYGGMIARELGMRDVIVPRHPGVFAAEGLLAADIRHMAQAPFRAALKNLDVAAFATVVASQRAQMERELDADGVAAGRRSFRLLGDLRYIGQFHEIVCPLPLDLASTFDAAALARMFHDQHAAHYGHADEAAPVEIVNVRLEAFGRLDTPAIADAAHARRGPLRPSRHRSAVMGAALARESVAIYDREALSPGDRLRGPAIVVQRDSTTILLAGQIAEAGAWGTLRISEERP
jgi:N-methylhydantoinase A/oxoprolinase/acetone carboxylase beta subunit